MEKGRSLYRKGYDPLYWNRLSQEALEVVTKDECLVWLKHPCTKALMHELQASIAAKINGWINGSFADSSSVDHTAMAQAKAIGQAQACDEIIDLIQDIGKGHIDGE